MIGSFYVHTNREALCARKENVETNSMTQWAPVRNLLLYFRSKKVGKTKILLRLSIVVPARRGVLSQKTESTWNDKFESKLTRKILRKENRLQNCKHLVCMCARCVMDSHKICISFVPKATNFHFTSLCAVKVEHEITGEKAQMVVSYMPFRGLFAAFFDCACEKLITFCFRCFKRG